MPPKKRKVASKTNGEKASHVKAARAARAARADPHDEPPRDESSESMTDVVPAGPCQYRRHRRPITLRPSLVPASGRAAVLFSSSVHLDVCANCPPGGASARSARHMTGPVSQPVVEDLLLRHVRAVLPLRPLRRRARSRDRAGATFSRASKRSPTSLPVAPANVISGGAPPCPWSGCVHTVPCALQPHARLRSHPRVPRLHCVCPSPKPQRSPRVATCAHGPVPIRPADARTFPLCCLSNIVQRHADVLVCELAGRGVRGGSEVGGLW